MSVFAKLRTATLTAIPGFPGHSVSIHGLSPRSLEAAAKEHQRQVLAVLKEAKESGTASAFEEVDPEAVKTYQDQLRANPLSSYDAATLIEKAVDEWSFELAPSPESIAELDEDIRDYIATEILRLSKPSLFRTQDQQEADRKNA